MKKLIKHVFREHRYPAIAVILLLVIFSSVPEMQAREIKQASVARIATIGTAFSRAAGLETGDPPKYISALRQTGNQIASTYSSLSKKTNRLAIRMEELITPSASTALDKALSGGVLAVGDAKERGDTALFDIEITPADPEARKGALPMLVLIAAFLFVLVMIAFIIRKIKRNAAPRNKN